MSKKSAGTGIMRLLFGLGKKEMKVIPYNQMTSEQFDQLDSFLGKVGFAVASDSITLTKKQSEYVINQIQQLDLYRKNIASSKNPDFTDFIPREELGIPKKPTQTEINKRYRDANPFIGFKPKVIEGGKGKTKPGSKIDYDKMSEFLGVKLRGDETFDELLEIEKRMKKKDPEDFAGGGLATMFRPKLKDGGPPNPGRRTFMKLMAGLASIPIVGKIFKPAAKVSSVVPLKNTTTTMPDWFPSFVDKVVTRNVGNKIDADIMVFKDKELPGIEVYKHDDGRVFVSGKNDYSKSYEIEYEPPGHELVDESTGKAVKTKGDFMAQEEVPVNVDPDGNADFDGEVLESVDDILSSDARVMEEYATGKTVKEMKRGEYNVGQAEARAEQAADEAAELSDEFAKGGLATMFRKK